jgi:hypothetical protein
MTRTDPPFFTNLERPTIVCLCGSTRFYDVFSKLNLEETLAGKIVLSIASDRKTEDEIFAGFTSTELAQKFCTLEKITNLFVGSSLKVFQNI